jgi:hypothetical protein
MTLRANASVLTAAALSLLWASPALAQGLGEAAAKARERRKATSTRAPAKVFTDRDLAEKAGATGSASPAPAAGANPAPVPEVDRSGGGSEGGSEQGSSGSPQHAEWKSRFEDARRRLREAEEAAARADQEADVVAGVQTDWLESRGTALRNQRKAHSDVAVARQRLADLEEQARRAGVPPGWIRE